MFYYSEKSLSYNSEVRRDHCRSGDRLDSVNCSDFIVVQASASYINFQLVAIVAEGTI